MVDDDKLGGGGGGGGEGGGRILLIWEMSLMKSKNSKSKNTIFTTDI